MNALDRLVALEHHGIKLGLANIQLLLDALGRPHDHWPALHIAGTNGKGSVTAMAERALRAAGYRTGRYTSPHLSHLEERVAIDGVPIDHSTFAQLAREVFRVVDRLLHDNVLTVSPTFFEVTTAIAFQAFRDARITAGVIEVGLGGRFDATNVLTPCVCAITSIALDHERYLGSSIAEIAYEKAGIIKPGVPVVVGPVPPEAGAVINRIAVERNAPLVETATTMVQSEVTRGRATISLATERNVYDNVRVRLSGAHQVDNAVTAIHVLEAAHACGIAVDKDAIIAGVEDAYWPARLEWMALTGHHILLDAAHNPAGARALASYLSSIGAPPLPIVVAVMRDKDVAGMVRTLAPCAAVFLATETGTERSMTVTDLAQAIAAVAPDAVIECHPDKQNAVTAALRHQSRLVVAGSIFLVGPIRDWLLTRGAAHCAEAP